MTGLLTALFGALSPLWEMSLTAAYAAAIVALLRLVLKKRAPRQVLCLLWLVVFARLLIPVSLESPMSIVPDGSQVEQVQSLPSKLMGGGQTIPVQDPVQDHDPAQNPAQGQPDGVTAAPVSQGSTGIHTDPALSVPNGTAPAGPQRPAQAGFPWQAVIAGVWLAGALVMGGYGFVSYLRLRHRLYDAIRAEDGAWEHPAVSSPFILGMLRPRIYLPAGLYGQPRQFILCHERAHLRRLDHVVKPVCWAALALHWFNPLVWMAFILMSRDTEAACDEAVIRQLGPRVKADYSATLLSLATNGRVPAPCPLAFDEGNAKGRIKNVLRYRRPALWIVVVSVVMAALAAVCLLTDPVSAQDPDGPDPDASVSASQEPDPEPDEGLNALLDPWMLDVLNADRTFTTGTEEFNIHQLRTMVYGDEELPKLTLEVGRLAIIDLDRDGINEMVVWPAGESVDSTEVGYYTGYFIFRRQGDMVRVDYPGWRSIGNLKADGTFDWSSSAFEWGTGRARFTNGVFEVEPITWCVDYEKENENGFVNGLSATWEEFEAAWAAHQAKPEPTWYVFEDGVLKVLSTAASINVPIPLDEYVLTAPVPDFLDADQQMLYRQTLTMYSHIFGAMNDEADFQLEAGGSLLEPAENVERDGFTYIAARGLYGLWDDFERAALSVFTRDFWNSRNTFEGSDGSANLYINVNGRMYFLNYGRGNYGYNENFPATFRLVERTDDTISFIITGYYSDPWPMEGESYEERDARLESYWDYSIEYPIRMVKTENGWRFDEFHSAYTDNGLLEFSSQAVPNPNVPAAVTGAPEPSPEPTPSDTPEPTASASATACMHGLEDIRLEYVGSQLAAICNQCDFTYRIPGVTSANWNGATGQGDGSGWMKENVDGDDATELMVYTTDHRLVSLKMVNGTAVASSFDCQTLVDDFNQNCEYRMDIDNKIMEVTYRGQTAQATLDDAFWNFALNRGGGYAPEVWLTEYWANRLTFGFRVHNARGYDLHINAFWSLSYDASGRLQIGSFSMYSVG